MGSWTNYLFDGKTIIFFGTFLAILMDIPSLGLSEVLNTASNKVYPWFQNNNWFILWMLGSCNQQKRFITIMYANTVRVVYISTVIWLADE